MKTIHQYAIIAFVALSACATPGKEKNQQEAGPAHEQHSQEHRDDQQHQEKNATAGILPKEQTAVLLDHYLSIKDALVASDASGAQSAASRFVTGLPAGKDHPLISSMRENAAHIEKSREVKDQRTYFEMLSGQVEEMIRATGAGIPVYKQYCPMAFNNKGASWLSTSEEIENPYFGEQMLHCGSVRERF